MEGCLTHYCSTEVRRQWMFRKLGNVVSGGTDPVA